MLWLNLAVVLGARDVLCEVERLLRFFAELPLSHGLRRPRRVFESPKIRSWKEDVERTRWSARHPIAWHRLPDFGDTGSRIAYAVLFAGQFAMALRSLVPVLSVATAVSRGRVAGHSELWKWS